MMKMVNKFTFLFAALVALCFVGCVGDDFEGTTYQANAFRVGGTTVSALGVSGDFDIGKASEKSVSYTVNSLGEPVSGIDISISHPSGASGSLGTSTTFPDARTVSLDDALAATGMAIGNVAVGDQWTIAYSLSGEERTSFNVNTVTTFKSALAGAMTGTAVVTNQEAGYGWDDCEGNMWTGPIELVRMHQNPDDNGVYTIMSQKSGLDPFEDTSFGAYYACYDSDAQGSLPNGDGGAGDLRLLDNDNVLSFSGASQWGEVFSISNVATDGASLTFNWVNNYGEGALITLVRDDGEDWPALSN